MVAQRSKKVAKYTYAERVLGALSQVKKEHRKHAVHLATIRAQVRKSAQEKKDKLGPQWSRWVGKAVHKLEAGGLLTTADSNGSVTFTPDGKKAVTAARRSVIGNDVSASPAQEDMIWRNLSHQLSTCGLKRKQPLLRMSEDAQDSDGEYQVSTPSKNSSLGPKRARVSARKTLVSRMNKAELMAELKSLRQAHANTARAVNSDDVEGRQMRQELKNREKEIEAIRHELTELKRVAASDETESINNEQPWSRPVTPEPNLLNAPSRLVRSRPIFGIRTQSGSFISAISKQPTPAPSSPGMDHGEDPFSANDADVFGGYDEEIPQDGVQMMVENMLATPVSTPNPKANKIAELTKEIEKYKLSALDARKQSEDSHQALQGKVFALQALEEKHESVVSDRDSLIAALQAEVSNYRQQISENNIVLLSKDTQILELQSANSLLESTATCREVALADLRNSVTMSHKHIEEQTAKCLALEQNIEALEAERSSITSKMADVAATNNSLSEHLANVEATNISLSEQIAVVVEEDSQARVALTEARTSLATIKARAGTLSNALIMAKSVELELKDLLSAEERKAHALSCKVESLEALVKGLKEDLESSRLMSRELKAEFSETLAEREISIAELSNSRDAALSSASMLSVTVESLKGELLKLQLTLKSTTLQFESCKRDIAQLVDDNKNRTLERDEYLSKLAEAELLRVDLSRRIMEDQGTVGLLRADLQAAQMTMQGLQTDLKSMEHKEVVDGLAHKSIVSSLEGSLMSMQQKAATTKSQLELLTTARDEVVLELKHARAALDVEATRVSALTDDLTIVTRRAHDAEQEVVDLQQSKAADEATIEGLKGGYARLRQVQIDSLAELDGKIASAQSSPLPKRRLEQ